MANSNRGGSRSDRSRNNNPEGRNQYSGVIGTARGNPLTTALAVGGTVAAGVFLWSRRNQISDQLDGLGDRISELRDGFGSPQASVDEVGTTSARTQSEIAEEALTLKETGQPT